MQEYSCCKRINLHACKKLYIAFDRGERFINLIVFRSFVSVFSMSIDSMPFYFKID